MNHSQGLASAATLGAANKVSRTTDFDVVNEALSFANSVANRIEALADALCGSVPRAVAGETTADTPDGVLPRMAQSAHHTRGRLGDAMEALDRITRSLP